MSPPDSLQLGDFADVLPDPIVIVDKRGEILFSNARARSDLLGKGNGAQQNIKNIVDESGEQVSRYLAMCSRNKQPLPGKFSVRRDSGSVDTYLVRGGRVMNGTVDAICLDFHDKSKSGESERFILLNETVDRLRLEIKARKQVEAVLEAEKETLACVVGGQPLDAAMNFLARSLEKQVDGMVVSLLLLEDGKRLRHLAAPNLPEHYTNAIDGLDIGPAVGSCGTAAFTRLTTITPDIMKDPKWAGFTDLAKSANVRACWSTPIFSSGEDVLGTLAMYYRVPRDPTHDELQLISNGAYVAGIVIERYRSEEALGAILCREQQMRACAEAENRAKDEFLAMLGHELRNPLSAIANAAFALDAKRTGDEAIGKLNKIVVNETTLLKRILDDLLDVSRMSRGKLTLNRKTVQLNAFVEELQIAMKSAYPDRDIEFRTDDKMGTLFADASRLRQAVQNLLDNAIKYSDDGDKICLAVHADNGEVIIEVSDDGHGIESSMLPTIFDPFVQADKSIERSASGLGLGLALVKQFTEMHGGQVAVRSDGAGKGSTFTLTIPRSGGEVPATDADVVPQGKTVPCGPRKVLVVEDNENAREGLCQLLQLWGHEVFAAADGQQALDMFRSAQPDIALVDIGLPIIDGYELAATVRKESADPQVTLVALTGYGQDSDRQRAIDCGFDSHIVKPAQMDDLIAVFGKPQQGGLASGA